MPKLALLLTSETRRYTGWMNSGGGLLVKALCLRRQGLRLSADELRGVVPMLGRLRYEANPYKGQDGRGALTCLLMPVGSSIDPQVQLFSARIRRIDARGIIIQGTEEVWNRKRHTDYPQALWAWPIHPDEFKPPAPDPIDVEEAEMDLMDALQGR